MGQTAINVGTAAGDGTGDNLRSAGIKINANMLDISIKRKIANIMERYAKAKEDNPRTRAVMATPPAVTVTTTAPTYTQQWPTAPASAADYAPVMKHYGGWLVKASVNLLPRAVTTDSTAAINRSGTANSLGTLFIAEFWTDAPVFSVAFNRGNVTNGSTAGTANYSIIKAIVDGYYTSTAGYTVPDNAFSAGYLNFDFTSAGGRTLRRIRIESSSDNGIGCIYTNATDTVFAPSDTAAPRIMIITDSYGLGVGATAAVDGWALQLGHFLGNPNIFINAIGGTGYLVAHGTGHDTVLDRINAGDVTTAAPDFIILPMSVNDGAALANSLITRANFQARVAATLTALRVAAPNVPVVVLGPWTPGGANPTQLGNLDDDIAAAVIAQSDPLTVSMRTYRRSGYNYPTVATVKPVMWGTGNSGTPSGTGSNDIYCGSDGTHPSSAGHGVLARYIASEFIGVMQALAA